MCGIFAILFQQKTNVFPFVLDGLIQLQNRGYDSAGICSIKNQQFNIHKYASTSQLNAIDKLLQIKWNDDDISYVGFGHNRWATHGIKNDTNAHPHLSNNHKFSIVHNGIIENYDILKQMLQQHRQSADVFGRPLKGDIHHHYTFSSQTDTEVIANLLQFNSSQSSSTFETIQQTIKMIQGTYGLIIQHIDEPETLYCVRNGSPLLVGKNEDRVIVTSEQSGFCNMINQYITLQNDDICIISRNEHGIDIKTEFDYLKRKVIHNNHELTPYPFEHWTIKEIHEQPNIVLHAMNKGGRIKNQKEVKLGGLEQYIDTLRNVENIILLGCGTSYFASLYGMYFLKQMSNMNTIQVFDGAEFQEYDIPKKGLSAFVFVSQSGETKDLYRCIEIARKHSIPTIGIINVVDSLIAREVDCGIYCNAGKEVGVASTKAFVSQVVCLSLLSIWFAQIHDIHEKKRNRMILDLQNLSNDIKITIESCQENVRNWVEKISEKNMFLLGKGTDEYVAKEGALKIKEISYIHAEGYSSSSLKHGPFALLDESFPVLLFNLDQDHSSKTMNCYEEVKSRHAPIYMISNQNHNIENLIQVPYNRSYSSLLGLIPVQLFAYYQSVKRGMNPDKPKNLAKVVTVE